MAVICVIRHRARFPTNTSEVDWFKRHGEGGMVNWNGPQSWTCGSNGSWKPDDGSSCLCLPLQCPYLLPLFTTESIAPPTPPVDDSEDN